MLGHTVRLHPFAPADPATSATASVATSVTASISLERPAGRGPVLRLAFRLSWPDATALRLPPPADPPGRRDGLWEHTCLECFLAAADEPAYWEINLSPGGDWNVYRLEAYRQGLQPDADYPALPFTCRRSAAELEMALHCPLPAALHGVDALVWNPTAVLEASDGSLSYWAPRHASAAPDFHDRTLWMRTPPPGDAPAMAQ
ncbi:MULTISPECIES: DOMON-like domain-containing protein [Aphanothece]|uniref:DOMON-like domain-containing protein n=1 Tax=Aphanothece TaxID=1121 RepID=UPI003985379E